MRQAEKAEIKWLEDQEKMATQIQKERLTPESTKMTKGIREIIRKNLILVERGKISREAASLFIFSDALISGEFKFPGISVCKKHEVKQ